MENLIKMFMQWLESLGISVEAQIGITVGMVFLIVAFIVCKGADWLERITKEEEEPEE